MEMDIFIKNFAEQFDDLTEQLLPETEFRQIDGWSSLVSLMIISMVDEEYGVTIGALEINSAKTISDLFNIVKAKL